MAQSQTTKPSVTILVKGMVCSFCVQGVEKKLRQLKSVSDVRVDLEAKKVKVWLAKTGTLTDTQINEVSSRLATM